MNSIYLLVPIAMLFSCFAVGCFFWALEDDQYEDLESKGQSILFDDDLCKHDELVRDGKQND